jgi:uncharacterized membrane protein YhaH (DUF805 family)
MSFSAAVRTCFSKYATFDGRAKRSEFWWWMLFQTIVVGIATAIGVFFIVMSVAVGTSENPNTAFALIGILFYIAAVIVALALLVPTYAVGCRRLHDRGQSGWLQLLTFVPCGNIALIVLWVMDGTAGDNAYGPAA